MGRETRQTRPPLCRRSGTRRKQHKTGTAIITTTAGPFAQLTPQPITIHQRTIDQRESCADPTPRSIYTLRHRQWIHSAELANKGTRENRRGQQHSDQRLAPADSCAQCPLSPITREGRSTVDHAAREAGHHPGRYSSKIHHLSPIGLGDIRLPTRGHPKAHVVAAREVNDQGNPPQPD